MGPVDTPPARMECPGPASAMLKHPGPASTMLKHPGPSPAEL